MVNKIDLDKLLKQKKIHDELINRYRLHKEIKILCPFCNSLTNIWSIKNHLKGINCIDLRNIFLKEKPDMYDQLKIKINNLKKEIKYNKLNN